MRLLSAEILKLRRRWASYVVLLVLLVLMALIYGLVGLSARGRTGFGEETFFTFPAAYAAINSFVFGLGSLLAVTYAAAIAGADWNWGVLRVVVARGESRVNYVLAKALGVAIFLLIGTLIAYAVGIALTLLAAGLAGADTGSPLRGDASGTLLRSLGYGYLVLIERAAIGFGVAMLLRSQLAGIVIGIVLYIGEQILVGILTGLALSGQFSGSGVERLSTQWYQFLPFTIGGSVLSAAVTSTPQQVSDVLLSPVSFGLAVATTLIYVVGALLISLLVTERAEINA